MSGLAVKISEWIREKAEEAKAEGIVVGMSGGVDSSVVAVLAKKTVKTLGLIMPCHSGPSDVKYAKMVAEKFGIETEVVDLSDVYDSLIKILPDSDKKTKGNLKARLRMSVLYYFANRNNYLVAGTSNRCEIAVGYLTKYGDSGVDIEPLGNLLKSEVRKLAKELGIPEEVINRKPSACLWEDQTDEKELGVSYDDMENAIRGIEENRAGNLDKKLVDKVKEMIEKSEHKRRMPPVFRPER